jgi:hypothetical protein
LIADQWGYVTQTTQNCASAATTATVIARPRIFGRATGSTRLRSEGRVDQATGNTKQAGAKM